MEALFVEEIQKKQNYKHKKTGVEVIEGSFFYSYSDFVGKNIMIVFDSNDIINSLQFGCDKIKRIVEKTIYSKIEELRKPCGLLIDYKIVESKIEDKKVFFKALITQCEADC